MGENVLCGSLQGHYTVKILYRQIHLIVDRGLRYIVLREYRLKSREKETFEDQIRVGVR